MRFSTGAGGVAAAMLLLLLGTVHATPSRALQLDVPPTAAPASVPATPAEAAPAPNEISVPDTAQPAPRIAPETIEAKADIAETETLDDAERNCLATAVYFEAKGEPMRGQLAVAHVILNRTRSGRFPATVCGVVKQRGQFSFVHGGHLPPAPHNAAWRTATDVARAALEGEGRNAAPHALFFHARGVSAGWHAVRVAQIGNQVFYR